MRPTETPTARLALAGSLLHLNLAVRGSATDGSQCFCEWRPERIGGHRAHWNHPGVAPFVGRCSVTIGDEPIAGGRQPARFISGSAITLTHGESHKIRLLLFVVHFIQLAVAA